MNLPRWGREGESFYVAINTNPSLTYQLSFNATRDGHQFPLFSFVRNYTSMTSKGNGANLHDRPLHRNHRTD